MGDKNKVVLKGLIQVYTGDGKGKTTAAVGLAVRALGAGLRVAFFQFFKPGNSSEVRILKEFFPMLLFESFGREGFVKVEDRIYKVDPETRGLILSGWQKVKIVTESGKFDVVVLDEISYALIWDVIDLKEFLEFLKAKPKKQELVLTGRSMPEEVLELADLVTEVKKTKHYYDGGVMARRGIEF